jgi:beta-ribofuranosylaminobenzene 5'-phosphate synthase
VILLTADCVVTGYPRLHFGLIDLSGSTDRVYGGVGVSFRGVATVVRARRARALHVGPDDLSDDVRAPVLAALRRADWAGDVHVDVCASAPEHVGLGSRTTVVLCALRAAAAVARRRVRRAELQRLSGRGRTSGVGVHAFFDGGLVVDAGAPRQPGTTEYLPSSRQRTTTVGTRLLAVPMPSRWRVSLALYDAAAGLSDDAEAAFFHDNTPTDPADTVWALADLYHGMVPAVVEQNLDGFARALHRFQARGFKRAEVAAQPAQVRTLLDTVAGRTTAACGLSSTGPLVFAIHRDDQRPFLGVATSGFRILGPFAFHNEGHTCHAADYPRT